MTIAATLAPPVAPPTTNDLVIAAITEAQLQCQNAFASYRECHNRMLELGHNDDIHEQKLAWRKEAQKWADALIEALWYTGDLALLAWQALQDIFCVHLGLHPIVWREHIDLRFADR